ncbi:M23 family metallopeptidase [Gandjariella thermophila]|uniref:M23ase beta-sheet core domain-containing protein n=1 Tax=Gandjariella thermophila TaxID=1931992 RepID=A0A4D4J4V5_9PSEU|nr:M23 family metallopeptidase [Gandjariella thermophila]GDY29649.1 hypothetical protein GTS_12820 [Gandjariella thermophila]
MSRPAPKGASLHRGQGRHRRVDQPLRRTRRVAATVTTGVLATAIGAASLLASDHARAGRAHAVTLHAEGLRVAAPSTVAAASNTEAAPAPARNDPTGAPQAQAAPVVPQPASTYDTPDDPAGGPADGAPAPTSTTDQPPATTTAPAPTDAPPETQGRPGFVKPSQGVLTSGFGPRSGGFHYGIDIANRMGTPEVAVANAVVIQAGPASGFGLWVRLRLDDGTVVVYGHMDRILVRQGQRVAAGQQIATMGMRGQATGPHLHFEVWVNGSQGNKINPLPWLAARGIRV